MNRLLHTFLALALLALSGNALAETPVQLQMQTSKGSITLELYPDKAPKTVANFLRYVDEGFYNGTIFHRVIDGFMIQGGGFDEQFREKSTHEPIPNEADNGLGNTTGTIAMARTNDPHSATAQFFINVNDNAPLDHQSPTPRGWGYAVFGRVIEGMEVVEAIKAVSTGSRGMHRDVPRENVVIEQVSQITPEED